MEFPIEIDEMGLTEASGVDQIMQLVLKGFKVSSCGMDQTIGKAEKVSWGGTHFSIQDHKLEEVDESALPQDQDLMEIPLMKIVVSRDHLDIQVTKQQTRQHHLANANNKDNRGKAIRDLPKYTRNSLLDFFYRHTNISIVEYRAKPLTSTLIDHQRNLTLTEIKLIRQVKSGRSTNYTKIQKLFGYDATGDHLTETKGCDRLRLWAEQYLSSNLAIADNLIGKMRLANKLLMLRKRDKLWRFAVLPQNCKSLS